MITKAIIPVAGIGSRVLPASKSIPKELFPLVRRPVIHSIVEEAVKSGITDIIFVTSGNKQALADYFDVNFELEYRLDKKGKTDLREEIHRLSEMANFYYIRQPEPNGTGDAVLRAVPLLKKDESCVVMWGDDIIIDEKPTLAKLIEIHEKYEAPVCAIERIEGTAIERYGVIAGEEIEPTIYKATDIVEKPKLEHAPSNLVIVGMYIMTPGVVAELKKQKPAANGEIEFTHALCDSIKAKPVYGYEFPGKRFDCGSTTGWLKANMYLGLEDPELGSELRDFVNTLKSESV